MLKTNYTNLKLKYIVIIFIVMSCITILGIVTSQKTDLKLISFSKNTKITIEEKEFKEKVEDNLTAYTDNMALEIKAATPVEKISSRASIIRRSSSNNYISISQVSISRNMNLTIRTGLSRDDFITLMAGVKADTSGFFEQNAGLIYDLCEIYNINEIFFCGLISAESGWNIASNHRRTNNYISLMSSGGLIPFSSVEAGLEAAAKALHNNYLTPSGRFYHGATLDGVRTKFCPVNPNWTNLVFGRMSQII